MQILKVFYKPIARSFSEKGMPRHILTSCSYQYRFHMFPLEMQYGNIAITKIISVQFSEREYNK